MTVAALALALALLVAPGSPRHRFTAPRSPRWIRPAAVAVGTVVIAVVAPLGVAIAGAPIAVTVTLRRNGSRRRSRCAEESSALQSALTVLVGELRVGAHPVVAFESAAADAAGPVAAALRSVAARARLGADVSAGLRSVASTSTVPGYWERLSASWLLAQTHGLAIVALVRAAQRDIVARERFASSVAAGMAGARATAAILAGLPLLGIALGQLIGARPLYFLLSGGIGSWLLVIGVTLACAGLWWSDRITDRALQ